MKKETFEQQPYGGPNITDTKTLCSNVSKTNVQITPQIAIENLQNLEKQIQKNTNRQKSLKYLYNDINDALGINNPNPSHYGEFVANHNNCTIRVSSHNAHASIYDPNNKTTISIKIRPHKNNNKFQASTDVFLKEFVYYDFMLKNDPNLVFEIIDSIIQYLSTGNFVDKSGIAYKNESPTSIAEINNRIKYNKNMKRIRLTEGQLHNVIRESVNNILNEIDWKTYDSAAGKMAKKSPERVRPLLDAVDDAFAKKYPRYKRLKNKNFYKLSPEDQNMMMAAYKEFDDYVNGKYKYEKGGRGYYLDDEE